MKLFQVDAFTDKAFKGNPAGICVLSKKADAEWMQNLAMEMNNSETAFLLPGKDAWSLRWFTPMAEVELCGHATLASAHLLWEQGFAETGESLVFQTLSGELRAAHNADKSVTLDFPAEEESESPIPKNLLLGLGLNSVLYCGKNRMDYLVEVESQERLLSLTPNMELLSSLDGRGVIVTCALKHEEHDFASRCFYPSLGIPEDPVTGSAHCGLVPYWKKKTGRKEFRAVQLSRRGGELSVSQENDRVFLRGHAVTVFEVHLSPAAREGALHGI